MDPNLTEWIERTIIESDRSRSACKLYPISVKKASEGSSKYIVRNLKTDVVLNSGERQTRSLISKTIIDDDITRRVVIKNGIYVREGRVYEEVIPEMEDILRQKEPLTEFLWPEFYHAQRLHGGFLMEDLTVKGFKMGDRRKALDYDHCACVMKSLAKFHALGAILREKGDLWIKDFVPPAFHSPSVRISDVNSRVFNECAYLLETKWHGELVDYAQRLYDLGEKIEDLIDEEYKLDHSKFMTLNHGDCWTNNILFRHNMDGKPEAVRFIDFQMATYNSPAFDLQHFLNTSVNLETRDRKLELIEEYQKSLSESLRLFGYPEQEIPTLEMVIQLYNGARYYGFCSALSIAPVIAKKTTKPRSNQGTRSNTYKESDELYRKIIKYVLQEGERNGIL